MLRYPVKKVFGLTILYSLLIIGIFVLQFKNESVISRNIGLLKISVAQTQNANGITSLKNNMEAAFKGISFTADDVTPAVLKLADSDEPQNLTLLSWEQTNPLSYTFSFTNDTSLTFAVSDTSPKAAFSVSAQLPPNAESLSLTYKPSTGYSVTDQTKTRQLVSSKNAVYTMTAPAIEDSTISFTSTNTVAQYAIYEPTLAFTFASVPADIALADEAIYANNIKHVRTSIATISAATMQDASQFTENTAVAYIAEQAAQGHYIDALNRIPESVRRSSRRTYISAPFFDSLVSMNSSLTMVNNNMHGMIQNAIAQKNLDIFSVSGIAEYMYREDADSDIRSLAALPASFDPFQPSLTQATGILRTYLYLAKHQSVMADWIEPIIPACLQKIEGSCTFSNQLLHVAEKDTSVSFLESLEIGRALIDYSELSSLPEYGVCGRLIVNTAFSQNSNPDIRTLTDAYPLLVDNTFYPHYAIMERHGNSRVWAWTSARNITYEENTAERNATITIDFPQEHTHYLILKGIRPFDRIEIYGLSFHTDPRFENYNSSGYVYNEQSQTLFLKSRHKSEQEVIKLSFR